MSLKDYHGSCQCGETKFNARIDLDQAITCNCSRCERLGMTMALIPKSDFELLTNDRNLTQFLFHNRMIEHYFCKICGVESFAFGKGENGEEMRMINVNVLDGVDPRALSAHHFDGKNA